MPETVVYVPGFPSSHLQAPDGKRFFLNLLKLSSPLLLGPDDLSDDQVKPGEPIGETLKLPLLDLGKAASTLYDVLDGIGCRTLPFGWDWRRPVWENGQTFSVGSRLRAAIDDGFKKAGGRVTLIAHSAGGLAVRALLEADPTIARKLKRLISFGVPWGGAVKSLQEVCGKGGIPVVIPAKRSQEVLCRAWAAIDTLPPDTAASLSMTTRAGVRVSPLVDTGWLAGLPISERNAVQPRVHAAAQELAGRSRTLELGGEALEVVNVVGWGEATVDLADLKANGSVDFSSRSAVDPNDGLGYEGGDGTAPRRSAAWLRPDAGIQVTTYHLPVGWLPETKAFPHATLWRNPGGRNLLRHLLGGFPLEPFAYAAVDSGDANAGSASTQVRVRAVALDGTGRPLPGARIKTLDLKTGGQIDQPFDPANDGRHVMSVPLARIRSIKSGAVTNYRLATEITWPGGNSGKLAFGFFRNN